jgi:hypothetical protein
LMPASKHFASETSKYAKLTAGEPAKLNEVHPNIALDEFGPV